MDTDWMGYPENDRTLLQQPSPRATALRSDSEAEVFPPETQQIIGNTIRSLTNNDIDGLFQTWATRKDRAQFRAAMGNYMHIVDAFRRQSTMSGVDEVDILAMAGFGLTDPPTRKQRVKSFWREQSSWLRAILGLKPDSTEDGGSPDSWKLAFWTVALDYYSLYGIEPLERGSTYQLPQFVAQFGSFQTLTTKYGGPNQLQADLEAVKEKLYVPIVSSDGDAE